MLKYKLFLSEDFFKHFKQIHQFRSVVNNQSILQKLGLSSILFNFQIIYKKYVSKISNNQTSIASSGYMKFV